MGKTHALLAKTGSTVVAILLWAGIKNSLKEINHENISSMQLQA
jgi:hypothetical protein